MVVGQAMRARASAWRSGLAAAFALTRLLSSLLFGVSATDVGTYAVIGLFFFAVSFAAGMLPARRAVNVDPMVALR